MKAHDTSYESHWSTPHVEPKKQAQAPKYRPLVLHKLIAFAIWLVWISTFRCSILVQNVRPVVLNQQRAHPTHQDVCRPGCTDNSAQTSSQPFLMAYIPRLQYKSAYLRPKAQPNGATRAVPCSRNYHSYVCSHCLIPTLASY